MNMSLDPQSPVPLYHQLREILRERMVLEGWPEGHQLPSEHDLCRTYGVTRPTVRQALDGLVREGRVVKRRGKGSFVAAQRPPVGLLNLSGTSAVLEERHLDLDTRHVASSLVEGCDLVLEGDGNERWVKIERLRRVNNVPALFERTWVLASAAPGLERERLEGTSLYEVLSRKFGLRVEGGMQRFFAIAADAELSGLLTCRKNTPLLRVARFLDLSGRKGGYRVELFIAEGPFLLEEQVGGASSSGVFDGVGAMDAPRTFRSAQAG